ncbi:MAG: hypothetical protein EOO04_15170 [Chitinophagaceae bacterium]|nr:MAG: hypothetical protein EOO04_15170 [Chitinophagaceae bacterium]
MNRCIFYLLSFFMLAACSETNDIKSSPKKKKPPFVFTEKMVSGNDTAMIPLTGSIDAVLAQHWYLDDVSAVSNDNLVWVDGNGARLFPSLNMFSDGNVTQNPRGVIKMGKWERLLKNKINTLRLQYHDGTNQDYRIRVLSHRNLTISWNNGKDSCWMRFRSDGVKHENELNDPYHPANNNWRIPPPKPESDSAIRSRVKSCVRFYALYYRDNIKRKKTTIEFAGLPTVFTWYDGGIGVPDEKEIEEEWIACFYNKKQALAGYKMLKKLLVDYEFDWPTGTPSWNYRTFSVLEQMYAKL